MGKREGGGRSFAKSFHVLSAPRWFILKQGKIFWFKSDVVTPETVPRGIIDVSATLCSWFWCLMLQEQGMPYSLQSCVHGTEVAPTRRFAAGEQVLDSPSLLVSDVQYLQMSTRFFVRLQLFK
jgi:hypothetical protein